MTFPSYRSCKDGVGGGEEQNRFGFDVEPRYNSKSSRTRTRPLHYANPPYDFRIKTLRFADNTTPYYVHSIGRYALLRFPRR